MKFCPNCGAELSDDAVFCANCGFRQEENLQPEVSYSEESAPENSEDMRSANNDGVTFSEAIKLYFSNFSNFKGRTTKREYWYAALFTFCIGAAYILLTMIAPSLMTIGFLLDLIFLIPNTAICVRRLHDIGKPWYMLLWSLVPLVGFAILIVYWCMDSDADNQWGPAKGSISSTPVSEDLPSDKSQTD